MLISLTCRSSLTSVVGRASVRLPQGSRSRALWSRTLRRLNRAGWLDASELRIGLGCMRLSTDADRDEERCAATIAAAVDAGRDRVRHRARVRPRRRRPRAQRAAAGRACSASVPAPQPQRPDRDEGRDDADRRRLGPRRPRQGDPRRLRGEPRRARRPADRPLPDPRARPADAVADLGARARSPPRRGARQPRRACRT